MHCLPRSRRGPPACRTGSDDARGPATMGAQDSFILRYKMTGGYVLLVRGAGRDLSGRPLDIFHPLPQAKIAQMQRAGALPNPLPPYRHTIFDYLGAYILWWCIPVTFAFVALFQMLGIGSRTRGATRSA